MLGEAAAKKLESIPLSNSTIFRRITDISQDVQAQLRAQLFEASHFTLQFDESTDVAGEAILIGFVRYPNAGKIIEELFCYCSLPERTTAEEIFAAINQKLLDYELDWKNVVGICTDGAATMTGVRSGLVKRIATPVSKIRLICYQKVSQEIIWSVKNSDLVSQEFRLGQFKGQRSAFFMFIFENWSRCARFLYILCPNHFTYIESSNFKFKVSSGNT